MIKYVAAFCCIFASLVVGPKTDAQLLYKPWDTHVAVITKVFNTDLPSCMRDIVKPVFVESVSQAEFAAAHKYLDPDNDDPRGDQIDGLYIQKATSDPLDIMPPNGSVIMILDTLTDDETKIALTHEFGHWFFDNYLNSDEQKTWKDIWLTQRYLRQQPTRYSQFNADEGFADSFMLWVDHPDVLSKASLDYFKSIEARLTVQVDMDNLDTFKIGSSAKN